MSRSRAKTGRVDAVDWLRRSLPRTGSVHSCCVLHLNVTNESLSSRIGHIKSECKPTAEAFQLNGIAKAYPVAEVASAYDVLWVHPPEQCPEEVMAASDMVLWTDPNETSPSWGRESSLVTIQRDMRMGVRLAILYSRFGTDPPSALTLEEETRIAEPLRRGFELDVLDDAVILHWRKPMVDVRVDEVA